MLSAVRVFPYPVSKSVFDCLLFLLCQSRFFLVQNTFLFSAIINRVINTNIFQIQRFFQNPIRIGTGSTVCHISGYIVLVWRAFSSNTPFRSHLRKLHLNVTTQVIRCFKSFLHKLLNIIRIYPSCPQTHINFRSIQIFRLCLQQCLYIHSKCRITVSRNLCYTKFCTNITGKIIVRSQPSNSFFL
ncbi:unknown [Clostridium sp. CAG:590]|nr:unknown [Clostridium sp. CAG:590]